VHFPAPPAVKPDRETVGFVPDALQKQQQIRIPTEGDRICPSRFEYFVPGLPPARVSLGNPDGVDTVAQF
jgi:hypothetical protein